MFAVRGVILVSLFGGMWSSSAPLYLPGFFQKHNILPFHEAHIVPPDSEHPHQADHVVMIGTSRTPSGKTIQTAVDLNNGKVIPNFKNTTRPVTARPENRKFQVDQSGIRSLDETRPWRVAFGATERLVHVSESEISTKDFPTKTSPEGKASWKFLEENSVCILTETPTGGSFLRVVETGTGALVGNFFFENLVQAKQLYRDNFVVVHGWNRKFLRHELHVVSLYTRSEISVWELVSGNLKPTSKVVKSEVQKFIFPFGDVAHMEITKTRKFLSPSTLLIALKDGRVVRKLLPEISSNQSPNGSVMDFDGVEILTRGNFQDEISMIVTGPTMLESTSAVVMIGNSGLVISRVSSPLAFDSLGGGAFDVEMLVTSLAVVGAIFVASEILARRALRLRKWK